MHRLANGLTLLVHEDRRTPIVCADIWYFVGSKNERSGRTGFAHLFEHLMFEGSKHVAKGQFDELLENAGGTNNGSTSTDRTNYWETVPAGAIELPLHLESDRMGWFLETITQEKLDGQRDVVKNERRQSYDNRPYGLAYETLMAALYPDDHPYHWPVIGWMQDLDAATIEDVRSFFRTYYAPNNAALAIAGDIDTNEVVDLVEHYFGDIPSGAAAPRPAVPFVGTTADRYITLADDVQLPRIYMAWHTPPLFAEGDAEMDVVADALGAGKAARLYRELVHEMEIAQEVEAFQDSAELGSTFTLAITARAGISLEQIDAEARRILDAAAQDFTHRELERARNHASLASVDALQSVGGFGGKADRLNHYLYYTGDAGYLAKDLARYHDIDADQVQARLRGTLKQGAVIVSVVPSGLSNLAAGGAV